MISLALCLAAQRGAAAVERTTIASREGVLTLTSKAPTGLRGHWLVAFQEEISPEAGASAVEGRSLKGAADVDCNALRFQVAKLDVFEGPNFTGALLLDVGHRNEWRRPEPGTTLNRVLAATCGKAKLQATLGAAGAADALPADLDPAAKSAAPPQAPSAPPAPAKVAETAAPKIAASARSTLPSPGGDAFYAQLASLPSADAARETWKRLERAAPGVLNDRLRRLTAATVHGRRVYRVSAGGFGTRMQAETVCKALARLSAQCFVRPGDPA